MYSCVVHSFIPDTSIAPLQVHEHSDAHPTTELIQHCVGGNMLKRQMQL